MRAKWRTCQLGEVCTLQRGFDLPKKDRQVGKIPLIGSSGAIDVHSEKKVLGPGVVTGRSGSIGGVFYIDDDFWPLNTTLYVKDFHGNYPRFIYHLLSSFKLGRFSSGAGVPTLNRNSVHGEKVNVPESVEEQKRIVAILDEAFAGIDAAIANTEKNLANARELFESYLSSVFGRRGKDWCEFTLKEVCTEYGRGKSKHRPRNDPRLYGGDYPFIQTGDVRRSDHIITDFSKTYNDKGLSQSKLWPKGTICITIAANIAETGVLGFDSCFPDSIIGLVVDNTKASNSYVEFLLQSVKTVLKAKGKGSAQDNINLGTFEKEKFPFPPLVVQQQVVANAEELRVMLRELEHIYERKLSALAELKQSLLQKAFTGELTAENMENEAREAVI
ncbi:MAG: restriction endonuclease subunit S [Marinobacter sp.]|uniref:restriction endonuclease subunit S n=1 Tax=Marinobacter sp. TaxID=50741 RepID=UPI003F985EE5